MVYSPSNQGLYSLMVWTADGSVAGDLNNTTEPSAVHTIRLYKP